MVVAQDGEVALGEEGGSDVEGVYCLLHQLEGGRVDDHEVGAGDEDESLADQDVLALFEGKQVLGLVGLEGVERHVLDAFVVVEEEHPLVLVVDEEGGYAEGVGELPFPEEDRDLLLFGQAFCLQVNPVPDHVVPVVDVYIQSGSLCLLE